MELVNQNVKHKAFCEGAIISSDDKHIEIDFGVNGIKTFVYPDAFEKLIVANNAVQAAIMKELNSAKQAAEAQRQAAEAARKAEEEHCAAEKQAAPAARNRRNVEDGFGLDYNVKHLAKQPILTYQQVEEQFGIKIAGFVYHVHWTTDGDYMYSGEGKTGDQQMTLGNRAIVDAARDGKQIHLFVKFSPQEYYYQGVFALVDYTYEDD